MRRARRAAGAFFLIAAFLFMIFWEVKGRETIFYSEVIAAKTSIEKDSILQRDMIEAVNIPKELVAENALTKSNINDYIGKRIRQKIPENIPISADFFYDEKAMLEEGKSVYVIKGEWIFSMSSSIRRGDQVTLYGKNASLASFGTYPAAFVKDDTGREVMDLSGKEPEEILARTQGASVPAEIEIIASQQEYERILSAAAAGESFLIVQRGETYE